jgi:hypothetical protein
MLGLCVLKKRKKLGHFMLSFTCLWGLLTFLQLPGNTAIAEDKSTISKKEMASSAEKKWGILPISIQLTAAEQLVDYRYLVIDPYKAQAFMKQVDTAYLIDQTSGARLSVSRTKVAPVGQSGTKPIAGKIYPILFTNTAKVIKPGSKVNLVIGELRIEDIVVKAAVPAQRGLTQAKRAKWQVMQQLIRKERGTCIEGCNQDRSCAEKCDKAYKARLNKEYQKLLNEK